MDKQKSSEEGSPGERGVLHTWRGYSCSVTPEKVLLSRPVLQAALGAKHAVLLVEGGQVYSSGELPWKQNQASLGTAEPILEAGLSEQRVVSVAAGTSHSGAVTEDGAVHMWGDNTYGQCGLVGLSVVPNPTPVGVVDCESVPTKPVRILEVSCGEQHTLALSARHEVWSWGSGCQLGLLTSTFPVWKPQRVEHLAGRHVLQVACGASHSLALVRCLPPPQGPRRHPADKCGQCNQLLYTMTDKEDHVIISDSHYCPLGVELEEGDAKLGTQVVAGEAPLSNMKSSPSEPILTKAASPQPAPAPAPTSQPQPQAHHAGKDPPLMAPKDTQEPHHPPADAAGSEAALDRSDPGAESANHLGCVTGTGPKSSPYPDEQALKDYLKRLSDQALAEQAPKGPCAAQCVQALAEPTDVSSSDPTTPVAQSVTPMGSALNNLVVSCASAVGERVASTYEALSLRKVIGYWGPAERPEERVREEERRQGKKSSSLGDIREEEADGLSRRLSLPGLLSQVSPRLLRRTSRQRVQTLALAASAVAEADGRLPSLQTEVWSWGRGQEGQLGHGDLLPRLQPLCIKSLSGKEVIRVAAGSLHSVALTAQSQVYSWGSNSFGQLGHMEAPSTIPRLAKMSEGIRVWDVGVGQQHTLLLADGDCFQPILYYSGEQVKEVSVETAPETAGGCTQQPVLLPFCMNTR